MPALLSLASQDPAGNGNLIATHVSKFHVSYGLVVLPLYANDGADLFDYVVNDVAFRIWATDVACAETET